MAKMNINYPEARGCWIDKVMNNQKKVVKVTVCDYPAWRSRHGGLPFGAKDLAMPDGWPVEMEFATLKEAVAFCKAENYVVCEGPKEKGKPKANPAEKDRQGIK